MSVLSFVPINLVDVGLVKIFQSGSKCPASDPALLSREPYRKCG